MTAREKRRGWNGSSWISKVRRYAIYLRDGFVCVYCQTDLRLSHSSQITLDHIRARSAGGSNKTTNLITCCKSCNSQRNNKRLIKFASEDAIQRIACQKRRKINMVAARDLVQLLKEKKHEKNKSE